ncbi:MAG: Rnf-Nqr domain containing protein [Alkalispirochaeta sp.]
MTVIGIILTASLAQNVILVHYLGISPLTPALQSPGRAAAISAGITLALLWVSALFWIVNRVVLVPLNAQILETLTMTLIIAFSAVGAMRLGAQLFPYGRKAVRRAVPVVMINTTVFVVAMGTVHTVEPLWLVLLAAIAAGAGVFVALVPLSAIRLHFENGGAPSIIRGDIAAYLAAAVAALAIQRIDTLLHAFFVPLY